MMIYKIYKGGGTRVCVEKKNRWQVRSIIILIYVYNKVLRHHFPLIVPQTANFENTRHFQKYENVMILYIYVISGDYILYMTVIR